MGTHPGTNLYLLPKTRYVLSLSVVMVYRVIIFNLRILILKDVCMSTYLHRCLYYGNCINPHILEYSYLRNTLLWKSNSKYNLLPKNSFCHWYLKPVFSIYSHYIIQRQTRCHTRNDCWLALYFIRCSLFIWAP